MRPSLAPLSLVLLLLSLPAFAGDADVRVERASLTRLTGVAGGGPCSDVDAALGREQYALLSPRVDVAAGRLTVELKALFLRCVRAEGGAPRWTAVAPGAPLDYSMPTAGGGSTAVSVRREDYRLVITEESDLRVLTAVPFSREGQIYAVRFDAALDEVLAPEALAALERGEAVDLRLGLTPQTRVFISVDGGPASSEGERAGGGYALNLTLRGSPAARRE